MGEQHRVDAGATGAGHTWRPIALLGLAVFGVAPWVARGCRWGTGTGAGWTVLRDEFGAEKM
jgi:hypothetical protein